MKTKATAALLVCSALWCVSIIVAPLFGLASIYRFFSAICHQDPARSWHLFGAALPVCIRCASIYFAFTISLFFGLRANPKWLRISLVVILCEFVLARVFIDAALLRSASGIFFGLSAAPFVKQGVEEMSDFL